MAFDKLKESIKDFAGRGVADKEAVKSLVKDIQRDLMKADVDIELVKELTDRIKEKALKEDIPPNLTRKEHVLNIVYDELAGILGEEKKEVEVREKNILLLGLFGAGKTTTAAKLADFYRKRGMKVGMIAADIYRPAAYEQLKQNAEKVDAEFYGDKDAENAADLVKRGKKELSDCDIIIVDSAGRDSMDNELKKELKEIEKAFQPDEKILVVPADIGQSAGDQASTFNKAVDIDSVIVTKMDSSAKGGGALTSCARTDAEISFIGTGEKVEDLDVYDPEEFVSELLGVPDLSSLLEKAEEAIDEEEAEKFMEGEFNLKDFYGQMEKMASEDMFSQLLDKLPIQGDLPDNVMDMQEEQVENYRHIMDSMTEEEMQEPKIIDSSRAERIAQGSGTSKKDVRQMIKQYRQAKNMMDKFSGGGMKRGGGKMKQLMRQMGF
ncbi:MAG: signal recognition particle receptor subunit alpha [Candidatus Nanohaloarchaeota archaeon QJJ-9]|nr:signal recognition particle receptor subunit alpha [Candidatus Nanohaloarchaeota archaeon QJJ-9]